MKSKLFLLSLAFLLIGAFNTKSLAQSKLDTWPELKEFHAVLSETFHPSEEGNLSPIMSRATELLQKAEALNNSSFPEEFNSDDIHAKIKKMMLEARELKNMVDKKKPNEEIVNGLIQVHNRFHEVVGLCQHH